jgi:hypothetical protein
MDEANRQVVEMLQEDVICPSTSAWSSPVILVKKKSGELRLTTFYK